MRNFFLLILGMFFLIVISPTPAYAANFEFKQGSFSKVTGAAPQIQNITGLGFQPKAVIFYFTNNTVNGIRPGQTFGIGYTNGTNGMRSAGFTCDNGAAVANCGRYRSSNATIDVLVPGTPILIASAELNQLHGDGFALRWTINDANPDIIHYVAIGGTDVTHTKVGTFTLSNSAGDQAVTGLGFKPDFIMFLWTFREQEATLAHDAQLGFGFAKNLTSQGASLVFGRDPRPANDGYKSRQYWGNSIILLTSTGVQDAIANLKSMDGDGFTVTKTDDPAAVTPIYYLALKGLNSFIGNLNQPSSLGNQTISGIGFRPTGLIVSSINKVNSTAISSDSKLSFGAAHSSSSRGNFWTETVNLLDPSRANRYTNTSELLYLATGTGSGTATTNARADLTGFNPNGFTLGWTIVDSTARNILFVAFGQLPYERSGADTMTLSETLVRSFVGTRSQANTFSLSGSVMKVYTQIRNIADNFTNTESIGRLIDGGRGAYDGSLDEARVFLIAIRETFALAEQVQSGATYLRDLSDAAFLTSSLKTAFSPQIFLKETIQLAEGITRAVSIGVLLPDILQVTDEITKRSAMFVDLFDSMGFSASLARGISISISMDENLSFRVTTATRIYTVDFFEKYGLPMMVLLGLAALIVGLAYVRRHQRHRSAKRQRFEYPL